MQDIIVVSFIMAILGACYWILNPILWPAESDDDSSGITEGRLYNLNRQKEDAYMAIHELEFDHKMGKLSDDDFEELKNQYMHEALGAIEDIEKLEASGEDSDDEDFESDDDEIISADESLLFCTQCGAEASFVDRFCRSCGNELSAIGAAS